MSTPIPIEPESAFSGPYPPAHTPKFITPDLDPPGADQLGLTPQEISQFRELGFIIKRGLIPPHLFRDVMDLWWQQPPVVSAKMKPDDPATWVAPGRHWPKDNRWGLADNWMGQGPWPAAADPRPGADIGERVGRLAHKLSISSSDAGGGNDAWRWHGAGHDPALVDVTSGHRKMLHMVELLLGGPVKLPHRHRGIYSIFPADENTGPSELATHMDANVTELMAVTYLEDVGPQAGGFTVYPTSAHALYHTSEQALNWVPTKRSKAAYGDIMANVQPVEFIGKAGDVMFCHGWTMHSRGIHDSDRIRIATIHDFNRVKQRGHVLWTAAGKHGGPRVHCDMDGIFNFPTDTDDDPADGMREVTAKWILDVNEFSHSRQPPRDDIFAEWNIGQYPVEGNVIAEPSWWEKYNLPMLPTGDVPRGGGGTPAVPLSDIAGYEGDGRWQVVSRANDWMAG